MSDETYADDYARFAGEDIRLRTGQVEFEELEQQPDKPDATSPLETFIAWIFGDTPVMWP